VSRFVNLVRSRTPKITLYAKKAKCMMMLNQPAPDFETVFYDGELVYSCSIVVLSCSTA
jgi:polo-like kinase 4